MTKRQVKIHWVASKHGTRTHAVHTPPSTGIDPVHALCGAQLTPNAWPFNLPPACPDCVRAGAR